MIPANPDMIARAYNTHYEIIGYELGVSKYLEHMMSKYDRICHQWIPYYYYDDKRKILYLPRGLDPIVLNQVTGRPVTFLQKNPPKRKTIFTLDNLPRDDYQRKMIRFMVGMGEFEKMRGVSQQVLSLPTRSGKTYITIAALSLLEFRGLIIVNSDELRNQWRDEIIKHTQLTANHVEIIKSSEAFWDYAQERYPSSDRYVFISTHRAIYNAVKTYGVDVLDTALTNLDIGVKVIDEAHIEFRNTLTTDYFTDVWKTFYLTATFARSDTDENRIYQRAFNQVNKMSAANPERVPSIVVSMVGYCNRPSYLEEQEICFGRRGFNKHRYISRELRCGSLEKEILSILELCIKKSKLEGKILILLSSLEAEEHMKAAIENRYPGYKVCCHNSKNPIVDFREYGIVCATGQKLGTGVTIPKLRVIINTEPTPSAVNIIQTKGRLDVYEEGKDTFYFYVMNVAFRKVHQYFNQAIKILQPVVKEVLVRDDLIRR